MYTDNPERGDLVVWSVFWNKQPMVGIADGVSSSRHVAVWCWSERKGMHVSMHVERKDIITVTANPAWRQDEVLKK